MNWDDFQNSLGWKMLVQAVRDRQALIMTDLISCEPEALRALQAEYKTCEWFIVLPSLMQDEETTDGGT